MVVTADDQAIVVTASLTSSRSSLRAATTGGSCHLQAARRPAVTIVVPLCLCSLPVCVHGGALPRADPRWWASPYVMEVPVGTLLGVVGAQLSTRSQRRPPPTAPPPAAARRTSGQLGRITNSCQ